MLQRLLHMLADGSVHSHAGLAKALQVSPEMLTQLIADLERRGYVTRPSDKAHNCGGSCKGCAFASQCASNTQAVLGTSWSLTPKGLAYAARQRA